MIRHNNKLFSQMKKVYLRIASLCENKCLNDHTDSITMKIDNALRYSKDHLWVNALGNGLFQAGITDYAQDLLGDIVFVEFPSPGSPLTANTPCGIVESVKTGSDLHAPLDGVVVDINESLKTHPEQINDAPYQTWIFTFKSDQNPLDLLMDASAYQALVD
jgi:glycine cleavage system H protein